MFAIAGVLSAVRVTIDMVADPWGNPASAAASILLLSMSTPAILGSLIQPGRIQATKAALLVAVATAAGGSVDVFIWVFQTLTQSDGGDRSMSTLAGVAVAMAAIYRAIISFRQERVLRAAAETGRLPAQSGSGPFAALASASLLAVSSSSLVRAVASISSVMIGISFAFALVGSLLLMCTPQPPSSLGSQRSERFFRPLKVSRVIS